MKAVDIPDAIVVLIAQVCDGESILETTCRDYDHFISLPEAVMYNGVVHGKSGWSSDTNRACYKSGMCVATKCD